MNICRVEELILGKRRIAVRDIASNSGVSIGSVKITLTIQECMSQRHLHKNASKNYYTVHFATN
jgi:hypothetical protein